MDIHVMDVSGQNRWGIVSKSRNKRVGTGEIGESCVPSWQAAYSPSADKFIEDPRHPSSNCFSAPYRQLVCEIPVDVVGRVEVRIPSAFARPHHVADKSIATVCNCV